MGLYLVEIVLAVEDHFCIDISDAEAEKAVRVRDVQELVFQKVQEHQGGRARSCTVAFQRLRGALMRLFHVPRTEIRPSSYLESLVPMTKRGEAWQRLADHLGVRLPPLVRPRSTQQLLDIGFWVPALTGVLTFLVSGGRWRYLAEGLATGGIARTWGSFTSRTARIWIPDGCCTVEDAVRTVSRQMHGRLGLERRSYTREAILADLIQIASQHLGIPEDQIHADSAWVDDLRAS